MTNTVINSFNEKIETLNKLNETATKFKTFFEKEKFTVQIDDTMKSLNALYSKETNDSSALTIPMPFDTNKILGSIKDKKDLSEYYTLIQNSYNKKDEKVKGEQSTRKTKIDLENSIAKSIESIKENFNKIDELYTKSTKDSKHCVDTLNADYVNDAILKACKVNTGNSVNKNISEIESALKSIKGESSKVVAKYLVGKFEYSVKFTDILNAKNYFKALKELNKKVIDDYAKLEDHQKVLKVHKDAAKEIFGIIVDLQVDTADIINSSAKGSITEESKGADLGQYDFTLDYDKYLNEINEYAKKQFNKGLDKFRENKAFKDIDIIEQVKADLDNELNSYCPSSYYPSVLSQETEEDQMYCGFKSLVSDLKDEL